MSYSEHLSGKLPLLRRYARALCGSQQSGDAYVRALLEGAIADPALRQEIGEGRVELYRAFTRLWSAGHVEMVGNDGIDRNERASQLRLAGIPPEHRQALLLTTLEEFSASEAGAILGLGGDAVEALVAQAVAEIDDETATSVMIIEDEPLIAMQLEALVSDIGHRVVATATTRTQAVDAFRQHQPGLVLADIQLADASSGIDAVEDILAIGEVPVVFITAYPERLLTGERPEPTYLVTKPFREETVRAAISQALFFAVAQPAD
ncbi:MAG: response regulator [Sphingomonadales bacterium]|nr:response regulator [Sphingomonadales bacterium]